MKTREVKIGHIGIGGTHPIAIQSMTSTPTMETSATVDQIIRIIKAGADMVRLTVQNLREAENLENIKSNLQTYGFNTPLVADVHFNPKVAEAAARIVSKVRINPGNFVSRSRSTEDNTETIRNHLYPLLEICKQNNTALRIGVNHGSLSERILKKYGNTPAGMVESALEFLSVCQEMEFHQLVFSLKSSNAIVMVQANRLMVHRMIENGIVYPLHLGVTEAGEGEDGRLKSATGIGTLLADGIGDTVRVSLTEDPEREIPVAKKLVAVSGHMQPGAISIDKVDYRLRSFQYNRRSTRQTRNIGDGSLPVVIADFSCIPNPGQDDIRAVGFQYDAVTKKWISNDRVPDYIYFGSRTPSFVLPGSCPGILDHGEWLKLTNPLSYIPLFTLEAFLNSSSRSGSLNFVLLDPGSYDINRIKILDNDLTVTLVIDGRGIKDLHKTRSLMNDLIRYQVRLPVIFKTEFRESDMECLYLRSATFYGSLFVDGLGDGLWLAAPDNPDPAWQNTLNFGILQATRTRITKTEYISCPSCGRTLFNILQVTRDIRSATQHLKGLKIGIMGCIVNGPGEMADADYGYVGSGKGKINLFKGREVVRRNIPSDRAIEELVRVIRESGDWVDP